MEDKKNKQLLDTDSVELYEKAIDVYEPDMQEMRNNMLWLMHHDPFFLGPSLFILRQSLYFDDVIATNMVMKFILKSIGEFTRGQGIDWSVVRRRVHTDVRLRKKISNILCFFDTYEHLFWSAREKPYARRVALLKPLIRLRAMQIGFWRPDNLTPANNLTSIRKVSVDSMQSELVDKELFWLFETGRQKKLPVHATTQTIVLRLMPEYAKKVTIDTDRQPLSEHVSELTPVARFFPSAIDFAHSFARERDKRLGRVALVRLAPHTTVYGHYDGEPWLKYGDRYHLVVESASGSFMVSGRDEASFREGDFFRFENKKYHEAHNTSSKWRTHLIFDLYDKE